MRDMAHPQVPAHTQQNNFRLKMTPFEWTRMTHDGNSSAQLGAELTTPPAFLQHNPKNGSGGDPACSAP